MHRTTLLTFLLLSGSLQAATPPQSLAPFLDDEAIAIVRLDLTKLDVPTTAARVLGPLAAEGQTAGKLLSIKDWTDSIRKAGATELFLIAGLTNFPSAPPTVVIPLAEGADAKRIGQILCGGGGEKTLYPWPLCLVVHGAVVAGTPESLERIRQNDPKAPLRPGLSEALSASTRGELQLAFAPTADQRKILDEMIPTLPKEFGGGPISILTKGMTWGTLGVELEPKSALHVVIQASDPAAAEKLSKLATDALKQAGETIGQNPGIAKVLGQVELKVTGDRLTSDLDADQFASLARPPITAMRESARRSQCMNNMKQIMLAMHNYLDREKTFPPAYKADESGKPLLSWRVLILPYVDQNDLYKEFHLDEAWDSPHNKALIPRIPTVYRCPTTDAKNVGLGKTTYVVPRGKKTMFSGATGLKINNITDGTSNTVAVVDVGEDRAVIWTAPEDWEVENAYTPETVLNSHPGGGNTGFADGSARFIKSDIKPEVFKNVLTPAGGEVVDYRDF